MIDRKKEVLEELEKGVIGIVNLQAVKTLQEDLTKKINSELDKNEVFVSLTYNCCIKNNLVKDKLNIEITYIDIEQDSDIVTIEFKGNSLEMNFKKAFIGIVSELFNTINTNNPKKEDISLLFEELNRSMYLNPFDITNINIEKQNN